MLSRVQLGIQVSNQFPDALVRNVVASRFERLTNPLSVVETINVKGAIALIQADLSAAPPKIGAGPKVSPEWVEFAISFHGVHITSGPAHSIDQLLGGALGVHPRRCTS